MRTARLAPLSPRPESFYRRAAANQPEEICRIFGVLGGSFPMEELFLPGAGEETQVFSSMAKRLLCGNVHLTVGTDID